ncbi:hypothetical protein D3C85_1624880 [compost metagenome]
MELGHTDTYLKLIRLYRYHDELKDEAKALEMAALARAAGIDPPDEEPPKKNGWLG